jgi:hypothetical protein
VVSSLKWTSFLLSALTHWSVLWKLAGRRAVRVVVTVVAMAVAESPGICTDR